MRDVPVLGDHLEAVDGVAVPHDVREEDGAILFDPGRHSLSMCSRHHVAAVPAGKDVWEAETDQGMSYPSASTCFAVAGIFPFDEDAMAGSRRSR